jgi:hypothetical protein
MMWKVSKWNLKKAKLWPQSVELREWPRFSIVDLPHLDPFSGPQKRLEYVGTMRSSSTEALWYPVLDKPTFFPQLQGMGVLSWSSIANEHTIHINTN